MAQPHARGAPADVYAPSAPPVAYAPGALPQAQPTSVPQQALEPGAPGVVVGKPAGWPLPPPLWQAARHGQSAEPPQAAAASSRPQSAPADDAIIACKDPRLPPEVRLDFVKKVYGILFSMLLATFGVCVPFVFFTDRTLGFLQAHQWIVAVVGIVLLAQYIFHMCMMCGAMCGSFGMMAPYMRMMKTVPWNYLYLFVFSGCFGVAIGFVCAQYTAQSMLLVFGLSAVLILALTAYAVRTKADFTGCGAYVLVMLLGLLLLALVAAFFPAGRWWHKVVGAAGAMLFGFIIVYDTQQIFGSAAEALGGSSRQFEYSIDMCAFAAWSLYLDFMNFFLDLALLFGDRRD